MKRFTLPFPLGITVAAKEQESQSRESRAQQHERRGLGDRRRYGERYFRGRRSAFAEHAARVASRKRKCAGRVGPASLLEIALTEHDNKVRVVKRSFDIGENERDLAVVEGECVAYRARSKRQACGLRPGLAGGSAEISFIDNIGGSFSGVGANRRVRIKENEEGPGERLKSKRGAVKRPYAS